jgi:dTDP-4-dehydrorhamnose 3,5-epimerase
VIFTETDLAGVFAIDLERHWDERGYFARSWCQREFADQGLEVRLVQCNISYSARRGTLRGMHFQFPPHEEIKLVRCTRGRMYDVVVDLRPDSLSYGRWIAEELSPETGRMIFIPAGCAHGFQTLEDDTEVFYQMSEFYVQSAASGIRWDDPALGISWPLEVTAISDRDLSYPPFVVPDSHSTRPLNG